MALCKLSWPVMKLDIVTLAFRMFLRRIEDASLTFINKSVQLISQAGLGVENRQADVRLGSPRHEPVS